MISDLKKERDEVIHNNKNMQIKDKSINKSQNNKSQINYKYPDL